MRTEEIKIRGIDPEIKAALKKIASAKSISLNTLCKVILQDYALHPEIRNIEDKYLELSKTMLGFFKLSEEEYQKQAAENNRLMQEVKEALEKKTW